MSFLIVTHVPHKLQNNQYFAYAPYVNEMNLWTKNFQDIHIIAPISKSEITKIETTYTHQNIIFHAIPNFNFTSFLAAFKAIFAIPVIVFTLFKVMFKVKHLHLRCPGNVGLLGCLVQVFFPKIKKTAKYAGNWDPNSKQPKSYQLQKYILNSTFLTRNIKVLVYGNWAKSSKNIQPFFTASFSEKQIENVPLKSLDSVINILFVGTLTKGKQPIYALQLVKGLKNTGKNVQLTIYGEGEERQNLELFINENNLSDCVFLKGNQPQETIINAYKSSHFLILASKSEGWPKAVAEAMFFGCLPLTTNVSCVAEMIDFGKRGQLLSLDLAQDITKIKKILGHSADYNNMLTLAKSWANQYTTEYFETEIAKLLL